MFVGNMLTEMALKIDAHNEQLKKAIIKKMIIMELETKTSDNAHMADKISDESARKIKQTQKNYRISETRIYGLVCFYRSNGFYVSLDASLTNISMLSNLLYVETDKH